MFYLVTIVGTQGRHVLREARGSDDDYGIRKRLHGHIDSTAGLQLDRAL